MLSALALSAMLSGPADAAQIKITGTSSKSDYDKSGVKYLSNNVKNKYVKPWYEGDPGSGVGSWVMVKFDSAKTVARIVVLPGDWTTGTSWKQANRPKELELKYDDGSTETWTLEDEMKPQTFRPAKKPSTASIRFRVTQIYNGSAFPDTAISEIMVFDDRPGVEISEATASTVFEPDADGVYNPIQAADGVKDTYWCEGNKDGDGVGDWLELKFATRTSISGVELCSGVCAFMGMSQHKDAGAPTNVTLSFSDGSTERLTLADKPSPQKFPISARTVDSVKITIDGVRKGGRFNDTCISEVAFK